MFRFFSRTTAEKRAFAVMTARAASPVSNKRSLPARVAASVRRFVPNVFIVLPYNTRLGRRGKLKF